MELKLTEVAERIRTLREIMGFTTQEMAETIGCTEAEYVASENGETDFSFTFLFKCADKFGVDMIEILTGENPHLLFYSIVRKGEGLPIKRRSGFDYYHLAPYLKGKFCEPFLVTAPYKEEEQEKPIELSTHEGQEFDYILSGGLGPGNVSEALERLRPMGVDVSSGVETDGRKDPDKMRMFVESVRSL